MSISKRFGLLILASTLLSMATAMVFNQGIPNRADYTGQFISGEYVAPEINALAPPIFGNNIENIPINTYQLRGKPVIVNFWATWCGPCGVEMPILQEIYENNEGEITIIGVNLGESDPIVRAWMNQHSLTYDILIDHNSQVETLYNLLAPPSTYIISPDGIITNIFYGPTTVQSLQSAIDHFTSDNS